MAPTHAPEFDGEVLVHCGLLFSAGLRFLNRIIGRNEGSLKETWGRGGEKYFTGMVRSFAKFAQFDAISDRINVLMRAIKASEIGSYLYCRRSWWYRLNGFESINQAELAAGTELHRTHGRKVLVAGLQQMLAFFILLVACVMLTAFGLLYFLGR
jgi:hypothetical protein